MSSYLFVSSTLYKMLQIVSKQLQGKQENRVNNASSRFISSQLGAVSASPPIKAFLT